jgi:hypothetical protein
MRCRARLVLLILVLSTPVIDASAGVSRQEPDAPRAALSRADTAALVKADLAKRLKVPADAVQDIELVSDVDRQWKDANLGCPGRKPLGEPLTVPGFAFTLAYRGRQFVYHSDRRGRFRQCDVTKPTAPIIR